MLISSEYCISAVRTQNSQTVKAQAILHWPIWLQMTCRLPPAGVIKIPMRTLRNWNLMKTHLFHRQPPNTAWSRQGNPLLGSHPRCKPSKGKDVISYLAAQCCKFGSALSWIVAWYECHFFGHSGDSVLWFPHDLARFSGDAVWVLWVLWVLSSWDVLTSIS